MPAPARTNREAFMTASAAQHEAAARRVALRMPWQSGTLIPYVLISPALLCLLTFSVLSIFVAAAVSLTNLDISGLADYSQVHFIGLHNYQAMFGDPLPHRPAPPVVGATQRAWPRRRPVCAVSAVGSAAAHWVGVLAGAEPPDPLVPLWGGWVPAVVLAPPALEAVPP